MKWKKPNGLIIDINDSKETQAYVKELGWKPVKKETVKKAKVKKG